MTNTFKHWKRLTRVRTVYVQRKGGGWYVHLEHFKKKVSFKWTERVKSGRGGAKKGKKFKRQLIAEGETKREALANLEGMIRGKVMITTGGDWNTPWDM